MALFGKKTVSAEKEAVPIFPEDIYRSGVLRLKDVIAPAALEITANHVRLGEKLARTLYVFSFPRFLASSWFSPVINMDKETDISIFTHPVDTTVILKKLQRRVAEVQSQINIRQDKGLVRDPMLDAAYQNLENLRDNLQQAEEKLFLIGIYITIYGSTAEELDKVEIAIKSILESRLVYLKPALFQQKEALDSTFPMALDLLKVNNYLNSSPASTVFPFVSFDLTANRGILYGINAHNNSLVLFDRFGMENYNSVMFARSGSGKSYTAKLEVIRSLMFDVDVIIIDPEKEYEYLAEAVGGRYFNISLSSHHHINPFDLPMPREDEAPSDVLRSHIINLVGLFRLMFGGLTPEEDAIIDKAIAETYASRDITPDTDFRNATPPILSDFELVLSNMEGGDALARRLNKYTQGTWAGFLNQPTNVDINKRLVVFSIRDMEDELRPIAMYLVVNHIWSAIRSELRKRILVVDEAWIMMKHEDAASFLFGLVKRARKYYLGVATITQDVADFMNSPYGKAIVTNSSIQVLLRQSPSSMELLQKTFSLTEEEKLHLLESDVGEGLFFAGLKHVAIKVIASYTEDQIITSDPAQILAIKKAKAEMK